MVAGLAAQRSKPLPRRQTARGIGYHARLLSLAAMNRPPKTRSSGIARVAREIPLVGSICNPPSAALILSANFWRRFAVIDKVIAIKIAPFPTATASRCLAWRRGGPAALAASRSIPAMTTHILLDLMLAVRPARQGRHHPRLFQGRAARHWSVWTAARSNNSRRAGPRGARTPCR